MELKDLYQGRKESFQEKAEELKAKYVRFSFIRLAIFILVIFVFIYILSKSVPAAFGFLAIFLVAFTKFVFWHKDIQRQQHHNEHLSKINNDEFEVIHHRYQMFDDGNEFLDPAHPNSIDLDLFGPYSFFQYINRTSTSIGKQKLANYLTKVASKQDIFSRQESIAELKDKLDWRQDLQAHGISATDDPAHITLLEKWLEEEPYIMHNKLLIAALFISPFFFVIGMFLAFFYSSVMIGIFTVVVPALILKQYVLRVNKTHMFTTHAEKILAHYGRLIGRIEEENFNSAQLKNLQSSFLKANTKASKNIQRLSYIISQLNVRYNAFAAIFQIIFLWDLQWVWRLEKWKVEQKSNLPKWFKALEEFEALNSLATLYFNNPSWIFPEIHDEKTLITKELGHPLIDRNERISNDFISPTSGHIKLVTGSNMAGKSTFLRTVGLNIVLATSGSIVCAKEMKIPLLKVHTSMRTVDALHESTSSFYAELKRLKTIIEAVESEENIYFLLDEILKGTNSKDRHTGSKALIQQMINSKGGGIIATHDLELGAMQDKADGAIENLCMEVEVDDNKLIFDYKLKKGVSQSFNATLLMRNMGIRV